ncbi:MAG: DUF58 domain-containing protein [Chloroflexi bacterium]|nr:DUF58 domain-containing protein [Chloroflexota bacterium]
MRRLVVGLGRLVRRNHNLLFVLAAFGTMFGLATVSGYWLFYRVSYLIGGLVPLSFIWARVQARGLEVTVQRAVGRLQVGQQAEARVRLKSRSILTKLWLEVEDRTDMPGRPARTVLTLPSRGQRNWKVSLACRRRGVYTAGPVQLTTGDPFGLFRISRRYGEKHSLLVLPQPTELPYFWAPPAQLPGEGTVRRRTHYVTPNASTVRDYEPGDSYNRIHWRSTARLNRLMVKTFEMDPTSDIWVLLDLQKSVQVGEEDDSTEEYGVRIAASLANHFLQVNRMLGFLAYGRETAVLEPARGSQQYSRLLEALALARAEGALPLGRVLQEEGRRFGRHSTLIAVTPSAGEEWVEALQSLVQQGSRCAVVLMEPGSFGGAEDALLPFSTLVASDILTYMVRCGDDLSLALGPAGAAGGPAPERQKAGSVPGMGRGR